MGNAYQNGAGERCDSVKNVDIDSGDILNNAFQNDISDFNLDLLKGMSQPKTFSSIEGISSYPAAETLTSSCQASMSISESDSTQTGPVFPFRGYYSSSNEGFLPQPVFPCSAKISNAGTTFSGKISSGTTFKEETATSQTDFKARVLGNSFEPNNLH